MNIIWHGQSCFQITTQKGKNHLINIVINPFDESIGLKAPKLTADIVLITHSHYNNTKTISGSPFIIDSPGEYEIKEIFIQGIYAHHNLLPNKEKKLTTIYIIEVEGIRICHLGDFGQKELTTEQIEQIGEIKILMLPIGGVDTISAQEAVEVISQIEPKIIIPMYYQIPKLKIKLDGLDKFLKIAGIKTIEPQNKLSIKKEDALFTESSKIIILKP